LVIILLCLFSIFSSSLHLPGQNLEKKGEAHIGLLCCGVLLRGRSVYYEQALCTRYTTTLEAKS